MHGGLLLGLVSGVMASSLPGPGTVLANIQARCYNILPAWHYCYFTLTHPRFQQPCPYPAEVEVIVRLGRVRRLTTAQFSGDTDLSVDLTLTSQLTSYWPLSLPHTDLSASPCFSLPAGERRGRGDGGGQVRADQAAAGAVTTDQSENSIATCDLQSANQKLIM